MSAPDPRRLPRGYPMRLLRRFLEHFAHPHGFLGRVVAWRLGISNRTANAWTLEQLDIRPADRVLEVGFGSGKTLLEAAARAWPGLVAGIDPSETMLAVASRRCAHLPSGRVELKLGDIEAIPYPDASIDKAYAVQVIPYLQDPTVGLRELHRVLRPGGRVALFFEPKEKFDNTQRWIAGVIADIYRPCSEKEGVEMLRAAGCVNCRCASTVIVPLLGHVGLCALGEK
ncbi:MAG: methyltransferase domain-containing protein [Gemmatimonadetes bacterium]|nr:methyltransferase domain-containing protein [Gemmatimonadota bacterium]